MRVGLFLTTCCGYGDAVDLDAQITTAARPATMAANMPLCKPPLAAPELLAAAEAEVLVVLALALGLPLDVLAAVPFVISTVPLSPKNKFPSLPALFTMISYSAGAPLEMLLNAFSNSG